MVTNSISDSRGTNLYQILALFILSEAFVNYKLRLEFIISVNYYEILKREVLDMLEKAYQLSEDEKYTQALKYYKNILQIEHDNIGVIIDYGVTLQNLEFYSQALAVYDRALNLQPKNMSALINKGSVFHTLGKYTDAITCYNIALSIDKNNPMALVYKGLCIAEIGNIQLAAKYFKKALLIDTEYELAKISINAIKCITK